MLQYNGVGITAMAAAVPHTVINNYEYTEYFPAEQVKEVVDKVGIYERRFADADTCSSDLCFAAAEKLLTDNDIDRMRSEKTAVHGVHDFLSSKVKDTQGERLAP